MLLAVTPNPALDRTMVFDNLRLGAVHRTAQVTLAAGGKGMNVARAAQVLGQPVRVCAPLGGFTGQLVAKLATEEGLTGQWHWHDAGETRTCVLLVDPASGDATALNEVGPTLHAADWAGFSEVVHQAAQDVAIVTISGSLPPGFAPHDLAGMVQALQTAGKQVVVDTSDAALRTVIAAHPYAIKVNAHELGAALDQQIETVDQAVTALQHLRDGGIQLAAVSLGAAGLVAASDVGTWWVAPPALDIVSTIGSGDALLAGMVCGLLRGAALPEALRLGVACGSANALTVGGGAFEQRTMERISAATEVREV